MGRYETETEQHDTRQHDKIFGSTTSRYGTAMFAFASTVVLIAAPAHAWLCPTDESPAGDNSLSSSEETPQSTSSQESETSSPAQDDDAELRKWLKQYITGFDEWWKNDNKTLNGGKLEDFLPYA